MPEVNVQLSDRLAELVRTYDVAISAVCQQALEQEVAARMGLASLTPRSRRVLGHAAKEAEQRGEKFIGTEHLLLGIIAEEDGLAAQALHSLGVTESVVRAQLRDMIEATRRTGPSNQVLDQSGNLIGYMVKDEVGRPVVVTSDGIRVHFEKDEHGKPVAIDESGRPVSLLRADQMPRLVEFDDDGEPVVLADENDPRTEH